METSLMEIKNSLADMKGTLGNMQEIIGGLLQTLARINAAAELGFPIGGALANN